MIFFFSAKIGPKNSKFGILYSQRQHNDNQLHQIRSQTLSITTVPFELSDSGKILPQIAIFVSSPKNAIDMFNKKSTNRSISSSSRGSKREFPWSHALEFSRKDPTQNLLKVVKRTDEHGLAQASCRFGPDDSHGVAHSRNSSGDSLQNNNFFSVFSHSKHKSGSSLSSSSNIQTSMSSGNMRTDGHGLAQASCRFGPDDSHGVAMSGSNSGALSSSSSFPIPNSQSIHSPGHLLPDAVTQAAIIATRRKAWNEYQNFIYKV
jgi:hypothetical protein